MVGKQPNFNRSTVILTKLGKLDLIPLTRFYEFRCQILYVT